MKPVEAGRSTPRYTLLAELTMQLKRYSAIRLDGTTCRNLLSDTRTSPHSIGPQKRARVGGKEDECLVLPNESNHHYFSRTNSVGRDHKRNKPSFPGNDDAN